MACALIEDLEMLQKEGDCPVQQMNPCKKENKVILKKEQKWSF